MRGDPYFTLSQVALNDAIMIIAFAPIVGLLLGLSAITVPWDTLFVSVGLYIVVPVIIAQAWRKMLLQGGQPKLDAALATVVGVLVEVPVMLSVVKIVNATQPWYERGAR